jgi:hypothetical protein
MMLSIISRNTWLLYDLLTRTGSQMDRRSVRDQLVFSIGFATSRRRDLLCRIQPSSVRDARQHSLNGWFCDLEQSGSER